MKQIFSILLCLCTLLSLAACDGSGLPSESTTPTSPSSSSTTPTEASQQQDFDASIAYNYFELLKRYGKSMDSKEPLNIPTYNEDALFTNSHIDIGSNATATRINIPLPSAAESYYIFNIFQDFVSELRVRAGCSSYAAYDTDTGYRLYLHFVPRYNGGILAGYPIVVNKEKGLLPYSFFSDIKVGDPIEKVEAIDDVTKFYKNRYRSWDSKSFEAVKKHGDPAVSIHYLTTGILYITYTLSEDNQIVVADISFSDTYTIPSVGDDGVIYRIEKQDLPKS